MKAILNTAILPTFGEYRYKQLTIEEAKEFLSDGNYTSYVGHESTTEVLNKLLKPPKKIEVNRQPLSAIDKEGALIFKLNQRLENYRELSEEEVESIGYTLGIIVPILEDMSSSKIEIDEDELYAEIVEFLEEYTPKHNDIIMLHFGIDKEGKFRTYEEVSDDDEDEPFASFYDDLISYDFFKVVDCRLRISNIMDIASELLEHERFKNKE